jgi:hypothetical protein
VNSFFSDGPNSNMAGFSRNKTSGFQDYTGINFVFPCKYAKNLDE